MRPLLALLALALPCFPFPCGGAPSVAVLVGSDSFSLLSAATEGAVSLQNSRTAPGTPAILTDYLHGRRADQLLTLSPSGAPGSFLLKVAETGRVLELREAAGEMRLFLAEPSGGDGQKWRIEEVSPGRFRIVSRLRSLLLTALPRSSLAGLPASGSLEQLWRVALHPAVLAEPPRAGERSLTGRYPSLARQLLTNRESWLDPLLASRRLDDYFAAAGEELLKGMDLLVLDRVYSLAPEDRNYALTLLLWMLSQGAYARGDPITVALALANASLYAEGVEEVRSEIRRDVLAHFRLYRSVTEWQEGWAVGFRLVDSPLLAKLLWCYRSNQLERNGDALTLEEYRTFVDRIDVLQQMHAWARRQGVSEAASLRGVVRKVDAIFQGSYRYAHFLAMIRQWYVPEVVLPEGSTDDDLYAALSRPEVARLLPQWARDVLHDYGGGTYFVEVGGRRRDPQARMWLNYQWKLYGESGIFRGDCGTEAEVSMALLKASGLVAMAVYHTGVGIGHAYSVYYDPVVGRFLTIQDLSSMVERYGPEAQVTLRPMPLRLHDRVPLREPRTLADVGRYTRFVARGIDFALAERLYLDRGAAGKTDAVFTSVACPAALQDADGDGLWDADEARLGTDPAKADTDGDGFSDSWELERRFDPRSTSSPSTADLAKVLVGHVVKAGSEL